MTSTEFAALKEMINTQGRAIMAKTDADMYVLNETIKGLTDEIKKHNGRLLKLENVQNENQKYIGYIKWMRKRWILLAFLGVIVFYCLVTIYEKGILIDVLKILGGKL